MGSKKATGKAKGKSVAKSSRANLEASAVKDPGASALASLESELAALDASELQRAAVDVVAAMVAASAVAAFVNGSKVRARFAALPQTEFSIACVDDLPRLVLATRYARQRVRDAVVTETTVPYHLVEVGTQIKTRMMRLCEYHFEDDPVYGPIVADIHAGTGYLDLASDLERLAKIYEDEHDLVDKDLRNYAPTDAADARSYSKQIRDALGSGGNAEERRWQETLSRVWTLLVQAYDEVRETGLWLFRKSVARAEIFPSIFAAGRSGRPTGKRSKKKGNGAVSTSASSPSKE